MRPWESLSRRAGAARAAGRVSPEAPRRGRCPGEGSAGEARRQRPGLGQRSGKALTRRVRSRHRELEKASNPAGLGFVRFLRAALGFVCARAPLGFVQRPGRPRRDRPEARCAIGNSTPFPPMWLPRSKRRHSHGGGRRSTVPAACGSMRPSPPTSKPPMRHAPSLSG
jgi:hypothetical protein